MIKIEDILNILNGYINPNSRPVVDVAREIREEINKLSGMLTSDQVLDLLSSQNHKWASSHKISSQYVSDVRRGISPIGPKIYIALGLRKVVMYERIEE